jgi:4-amino-4-deoxy-L-arabinose transferase-like glycosyltransferase
MVTNSASSTRTAADSPLTLLNAALISLSQLFRTTRSEVWPRAGVNELVWLTAITILGTWVRFWGLGSIGLHGDEETMAMAVRHILIDGTPILPSGMFYPRGMTQLYLMAGSVSIFGESEWSLRLPSVLCGIALIPLMYLLGRRFLRPTWNLGLAFATALLPELIEYSQTARMYIFLVTCVALAMHFIFRWERTGRAAWLVAAAASLVVGIDMQLLAVAAVLMFLLPGLLQADLKKFIHGGIAAAVVLVGYVAIEALTMAQYPVPPPDFAASFGPPPWERSWAPPQFALAFDVALLVSGIAIAFFALHFAHGVPDTTAARISLVLLFAGVALQLALFYHLAGIAYAAALLLAFRHGADPLSSRVFILIMSVSIVALIHVSLLASTPGSVVKLIGSMIGQPSVWPYVRLAQLTEAAGVLLYAALLRAAFQFATNNPIRDYVLLALLGVLGPVFAMGFFAWNVPPRYTAVSLVPMLLCAFAFAQQGVDWMLRRLRKPDNAGFQVFAAVLTSLCVINPAAAARIINAGYTIHPDHKGAADFMRSIPIHDEDIVLAEDVLQQTYYLGKVDYWIIGPNVARKFVKREGEDVVDFYTGTPVIASPAMLDALLQNNADKRVFVIGSGEDWRKGERGVRGKDLNEAIESDRFEVIHTGRDGLTQVLRAVPRKGPVAPPVIQRESDADEAALLEAAASAEAGELSPPSDDAE